MLAAARGSIRGAEVSRMVSPGSETVDSSCEHYTHSIQKRELKEGLTIGTNFCDLFSCWIHSFATSRSSFMNTFRFHSRIFVVERDDKVLIDQPGTVFYSRSRRTRSARKAKAGLRSAELTFGSKVVTDERFDGSEDWSVSSASTQIRVQ